MHLAELLTYAPQLAAILLAATRLLPRLEGLWSKLPPKFRWLPPVLVVALPQLADALGMAKSPLDLVEAATLALALLVPGARSATHAQLAKDAPPPTPKTGSGAPPALPLLLLAASLLAAPALTSCSPASTPEARGAQAAQLARLGYSAAAVTVMELGDLHYELAKAVQTPEQARVAAEPLRAMLTALDAANAALAKARPYVASGKDEAAVRQYLREAVTQLDAVLPLLASLGKTPPREVLEALGYLRGFLGDGAQ